MKMKIGKFSVKKGVLLGVFTALSIVIAPSAQSQATGSTYLAETASIVGPCGKLFEVDANAAGLTAQERAAIIQKNLDYGFIHAKNRTPSAVQVLLVNHNPVVTLDGFHIATADGNSAERNCMTPVQLAQKWADSIKFCLADGAGMGRYLSMLTGAYPQVAMAARSETVAYVPAGTFLPIKLVTPIDSETSVTGSLVQATLTADVPIRTSQSATQWEAYLPAGSTAIGHLVEASNAYTRKGAFSVRFNELRTPDGSVIPIVGHIFGGVGTWVAWNTNPVKAEAPAVRLASDTTLVPSKGTICGAWRGNSIGAGLDIPFQKLVFTRRAGVTVPCGEALMLQMSAPSAIALCNNCGSENDAVAVAPIPIAFEPVPVVREVSQSRVFTPIKCSKVAAPHKHRRAVHHKPEVILK